MGIKFLNEGTANITAEVTVGENLVVTFSDASFVWDSSFSATDFVVLLVTSGAGFDFISFRGAVNSTSWTVLERGLGANNLPVSLVGATVRAVLSAQALNQLESAAGASGLSIPDGYITQEMLKVGSVTKNKLAPSSVGENQLGEGSVGETKLKSNSVGGRALKNNSITTELIQDGTITTEKLERSLQLSTSAGKVNVDGSNITEESGWRSTLGILTRAEIDALILASQPEAGTTLTFLKEDTYRTGASIPRLEEATQVYITLLDGGKGGNGGSVGRTDNDPGLLGTVGGVTSLSTTAGTNALGASVTPIYGKLESDLDSLFASGNLVLVVGEGGAGGNGGFRVGTANAGGAGGNSLNNYVGQKGESGVDLTDTPSGACTYRQGANGGVLAGESGFNNIFEVSGEFYATGVDSGAGGGGGGAAGIAIFTWYK